MPKRTHGGPSEFQEASLEFELELFASNQRLINEAVEGYTDEFRRYEARYRRTVRQSVGPVPFTELVRDSKRASVVLVGDYHTYPQAQRAFFRLLRAQPAKGPQVVIALEMILGKHSAVVDRFLAGKISERTFLRRIEYAEHWPFESFEAVRPIFELARKRQWRIIGIDQQDEGVASLNERDLYAAERIADALEGKPKARVFALIGELHLAPGHLPKLVRRALAKRHIDGSVLRVHQNPDTIWFDYAAKGLAEEHDVLRLSDDAFALLTASPVVCQQSFLTWLEQISEGEEEFASFAPNAGHKNVRHAVDVIDKALALRAKRAAKGVEVVGPADLSFFGDLDRSGDFTKLELKQIRAHILSSESCYIPRARMIYLATMSMNHAAEEAAHMLRHVCSSESMDDPKGLVDAFYFRAMNEAIAFVGSKIVNPKRKCTHVRELTRIAEGEREATAQDVAAAEWVLAHKRMERGELVPHLSAVFKAPPALFNAVTHMLGYILGDQLYYALVRGRVTQSTIRTLFFEPLGDEGAAILMYFELIAKVGRLRPPRRT